MKHTNTTFHQLLAPLSRHAFQKTVDRHLGDKKTSKLDCWTQLVAMLFAQFTGRSSLRDLSESFNSKKQHHYHLGVKSVIKKSTLSDANRDRPVAIYNETFFYLLEQVRRFLPKQQSEEMTRLIDSSTIDLNLNQFEWAKFRSTKSGIKLHLVYDPVAAVPVYFEISNAKLNDKKALSKLPVLPGGTYVFDRAYNDYGWYYELCQQDIRFVGRMKSNAKHEIVEERPVKGAQILEDQVIRLTGTAGKKCPRNLRRVKIIREVDNKELVFISNDLECDADEIASLYKSRWEIELFFKWIKQNLKIKRYMGHSENAVKLQIVVAMISYLLLRLAQLGSGTKKTLQSIGRLICTNLTSRRCLVELLRGDPVIESPPKASPQQELRLVA